jgi:hypothetical protein
MRLFTDPYILAAYGTDHAVQKGMSVVHTYAYNDNATSSPVSYLRFGKIVVDNRDKSAVTVDQVLNELVYHDLTLNNKVSHILNPSQRAHRALDWYITYDELKGVQHDRTKRHVKSECKDIAIESRTMLPPRVRYIRVHSNGTISLESYVRTTTNGVNMLHLPW